MATINVTLPNTTRNPKVDVRLELVNNQLEISLIVRESSGHPTHSREAMLRGDYLADTHTDKFVGSLADLRGTTYSRTAMLDGTYLERASDNLAALRGKTYSRAAMHDGAYLPEAPAPSTTASKRTSSKKTKRTPSKRTPKRSTHNMPCRIMSPTRSRAALRPAK